MNSQHYYYDCSLGTQLIDLFFVSASFFIYEPVSSRWKWKPGILSDFFIEFFFIFFLWVHNYFSNRNHCNHQSILTTPGTIGFTFSVFKFMVFDFHKFIRLWVMWIIIVSKWIIRNSLFQRIETSFCFLLHLLQNVKNSKTVYSSIF